MKTIHFKKNLSLLIIFFLSFDCILFPKDILEQLRITSAVETSEQKQQENALLSIVTSTYSIGGSVTGLVDGDLTISNNGSEELVISQDGSFMFSSKQKSGEVYSVQVVDSPTGLTCTASNNSGTVSSSDISSVTIVCSYKTYSIGGTISGLEANGLIMQNNSTDDLSLNNGDTTFEFSTKIAHGSGYAVSVLQNPSSPKNQTCSASNNSGIAISDITNITITCDDNSYPVSGTISNLVNGDEIGLSLNGIYSTFTHTFDDSIDTSPLIFTFGNNIAEGGSYVVTFSQHPSGKTCKFTSGGTVSADGSQVSGIISNPGANVEIDCQKNQRHIKMDVSGLNTGYKIDLYLKELNSVSNVETLSNKPNGTDYEFATTIYEFDTFKINFSNVTGETCKFISASTGTISADQLEVTGTVSSSDIDIAISCSLNSYSMSGTINGLDYGDSIKISNGIDTDYQVFEDDTTPLESFTFPSLVDYGVTYTITINSSSVPVNKTCSVTAGGSGTVIGPVTDIELTCSIKQFTIGGSVSGLTSGTLILQNNGVDSKSITSNGTYTFSQKVDYGSSYSVVVTTQPDGLYCGISNNSASSVTSNITNVDISCLSAPYSVSALIVNSTSSIEIQLNFGAAGETEVENSGNGNISFNADFADNMWYKVLVSNSNGQTCVVTGGDYNNGSGYTNGENVDDIIINCDTSLNTVFVDTYIDNLDASPFVSVQLKLYIGGVDKGTITITKSGMSNFSFHPNTGNSYMVAKVVGSVSPVAYTCSLSHSSGTISSNYTYVDLTCSTATYKISGTIVGLMYSSPASKDSITLTLNGGDETIIKTATTGSPSISFSFVTIIARGAYFSVTKSANMSASGRTCSFNKYDDDGDGTATGTSVWVFGSGDITDLNITCE